MEWIHVLAIYSVLSYLIGVFVWLLDGDLDFGARLALWAFSPLTNAYKLGGWAFDIWGLSIDLDGFFHDD